MGSENLGKADGRLRHSLPRIKFLSFFRVGVFTFGGGYAMLPIIMTNPPDVVVKFLLGVRPTVVALIDSGDSPGGDTDKEDQPNSDTAVRRTAARISLLNITSSKEGIHVDKRILFSMRFLYTTIGIAIFAGGILFSVKAGLGVNPWTVFHMGIAGRVGLTQGRVAQLVGLLIILASYFMGIKPHVATVMNMIMVGGFFDLFDALNILPAAQGLYQGLGYILVSIIIGAFGAAMYMSGGIGAGPRDSLMLALARRTGQSVARVRSAIEVTVLLIGWALGGPVGVGTVILSLTSGPAVQLCFDLMRYLTGVNGLAGQVMVVPVDKRAKRQARTACGQE